MKRLGILAAVYMATGSTLAAAEQSNHWTGFNVGASVGFTATRTNWQTTNLLASDLGPGVLGPLGLTPADFALNGSALPEHDYSYGSPHVGILAGYDYQIGSKFVVGVMGDFFADFGSEQTAYIPGTVNLLSGGPGNIPNDDRVKISSDWDASARLRAGVLVTPDVLVFASGGWAGADRTVKVSCTSAAANSWCSNTDNQRTKITDTLSGWTAGVGIETFIADHWTLRAEYRYSDYGSDNTTFLTGGSTIPGGDAIRADLETTAHAVNIAIVYRF